MGSALLTQVVPASDVVMILTFSPALGSPTTASFVPSMTQDRAVGQVTSEGSDWPSGNGRGFRLRP